MVRTGQGSSEGWGGVRVPEFGGFGVLDHREETNLVAQWRLCGDAVGSGEKAVGVEPFSSLFLSTTPHTSD